MKFPMMRNSLSRFAAKPHMDRPRERMIANADALRANMTPSEKRLWEHLRTGYPQKAHQWAAQKRLTEWFIVDFYCARQRLVVEVDGEYHNDDYRRLKDTKRDETLRTAGHRVLRVTNEDVDFRLSRVLVRIRQEIRSGLR